MAALLQMETSMQPEMESGDVRQNFGDASILLSRYQNEIIRKDCLTHLLALSTLFHGGLQHNHFECLHLDIIREFVNFCCSWRPWPKMQLFPLVKLSHFQQWQSSQSWCVTPAGKMCPTGHSPLSNSWVDGHHINWCPWIIANTSAQANSSFWWTAFDLGAFSVGPSLLHFTVHFAVDTHYQVLWIRQGRRTQLTYNCI